MKTRLKPAKSPHRYSGSLLALFALTLSLSIVLGSADFALPQSPSPNLAQDTFIEEVKESAKFDAERRSEPDEGMIGDLQTQAKEKDLGLTPTQVRRIYLETFDQARKSAAPGVWQPIQELLTPERLIIGFLLLAFAGLNEAVRKWVGAAIDRVGEWFYANILAGNSFAIATSLDRYQKSLLKEYSQLKIPFRPNRPLEMAEVYVPLKVEDAAEGHQALSEQIEAQQAIDQYRKLMVVGAPGSGKSILLKKLVLDYAKQSAQFSDRPIPILLELHDLSEVGADLKVDGLIEQLVKVLAHHGFLKGAHFVRKSLEKGGLLLLLDGLDEVNSTVRSRIVKVIEELLGQERYRHNRAVITCRKEVYRGEFDQTVDQTLKVVDFNDQQIRSFLRGWTREFEAVNKSVDELMGALRDRPRIKELASNPLLLTIIAHLYTQPSFVFPRSRAEFYRQSTNILLSVWHREVLEGWRQQQSDRNEYKPVAKHAILQHLALYYQDQGGKEKGDRRTVDYYTVIAQIKQTLPNLNLAEEDADAVLTEIVERSGLLIRVDSKGEHYSFVHLTVQEYFAAEALDSKPTELIQRYGANPASWREVVQLWCGLGNDSTTFVESIWQQDSVLGFECLAEAQQIEPSVSERIIAAAQAEFEQGQITGELIQGFGAVASDDSARGQAVFRYLEDHLTQGSQSQQIAAAKALAKTNLPKAAAALATHYSNPVIRPVLIEMGELAINELLKQANQGTSSAIDGLYGVGTPDAALALVQLLWHAKVEIAGRAAWYLLALTVKPDIEQALSHYQPTSTQRRVPEFDWIWQPFDPTNRSSPSLIMGRVAYLITTTPEPEPSIQIPHRQLMFDPRLVIPLCSIQLIDRVKLPKTLTSTAESLLQNPNLPSFDQRCRDAVVHLGITASSRQWSILLLGLKPILQLQLLERLINNNARSNQRDWRTQFQKVDYRFQTSVEYWSVILIALVWSGIAIAQMVVIANALTWTTSIAQGLLIGLIGTALCIVLLFWSTFWRGMEKPREPKLFLQLGIGGVHTFGQELMQLYRQSIVWAGLDSLLKTLIWAATSAGAGTEAMPRVVVVGTAVAMLMILAVTSAVTNVGVGAVPSAVTSTGAVPSASASAVPSAVAVAVAVTMTVAGVGAIGVGLGVWHRASTHRDPYRFLAFLAFPLFCSAPIVLGFSFGFLDRFFSWQASALILAGSVALGTVLWQVGQWRDRRARNPLQGLLDPADYGITPYS